MNFVFLLAEVPLLSMVLTFWDVWTCMQVFQRWGSNDVGSEEI